MVQHRTKRELVSNDYISNACICIQANPRKQLLQVQGSQLFCIECHNAIDKSAVDEVTNKEIGDLVIN